MMRASRGVALVVLGLLAVAALYDVARLGNGLPWRQLYDFSDFYCAGTALDGGLDPYRYEPLHRCEHAVNTSLVFHNDPRRVIPAPLPPYDFPAFMLAARSNFALARAIGAAAIVLAIVAAAYGLWLIGVPLELTALALLLPAGFVLLAAGQVVPYALVALVFCGVALARGRDSAAGICAALTLIEPHLGLPVCAALFFRVTRSRIALSATGLGLFLVALVTVGFSGMVEYLSRVLPAQASAEAGYAYQYSLTYLLRAIGAPSAPALVAGEIAYLIMLGAGIWVGGRAARVLHRRELLAFVPAACSVIGGAYVHMVDLPFALPASLVLATSLQGRRKDVATLALALLAVPWIPVWINKRLFLASLFVVAALLVRLRARRAFAICLFVAIALAIYALELFPPPAFAAITPGPIAANALAQEAWARYVAALGTPGPTWLLVKLPAWTALVAVLAGALASRPPTARAPR